jgi:hypothetical protein
MGQLVYEERQVFSSFIKSIFVLGDLFLITLLVLPFADVGDFHFHPTTMVIFTLVIMLLWNGLFYYFMSNSPRKITVTDSGLVVSFSQSKEVNYGWGNVVLKKIGMNPVPMIFIKKSRAVIPRIILLDGSSKGYKSLVDRITAQTKSVL